MHKEHGCRPLFPSHQVPFSHIKETTLGHALPEPHGSERDALRQEGANRVPSPGHIKHRWTRQTAGRGGNHLLQTQENVTGSREANAGEGPGRDRSAVFAEGRGVVKGRLAGALGWGKEARGEEAGQGLEAVQGRQQERGGRCESRM